jgi:hypothetical protein
MLLGGVSAAMGQAELLPVDHPATRTLVRLYEFGALKDFPREHLPISRGLALRLLDEALGSRDLPASLREQAEYYRDELAADRGATPTAVLIPTDDASVSIFDRPLDNLPLAIIDHRDSSLGAHVVLAPLLDGELRVDPVESGKALLAQGGVELRGTLLDHVGFAARVTNGSIAGDSSIAVRDPRIRRNGSFSVTGFGRDIGFGDGHLRVDYKDIAVEIGRERVQLGGGLDESLLLGAPLPSNFDYLRLTANLGLVSFSHIHAALLSEAVLGTDPAHARDSSGPFANIPSKYVALHLLSVGPFAGIRVSLGESVVYHGRGFEIGYLNPFVFMKSQEQYLRDRDNGNMYLALSVAPTERAFLEGELMIDDYRFSKVGEGFIGNKVAWRLGAKATAFPVAAVDLGASFTRLEPYIFTHFNTLNSYTQDRTPLAAGGLEPNSYLFEPRLSLQVAPNFQIRLIGGFGEHGANIVDSTGAIVRNVGGDINHQPDTTSGPGPVTFLDGELETLTRLRLEAEYEPLRNTYLRLIAFRNQTRSAVATTTDTQLWFGLRIGAY